MALVLAGCASPPARVAPPRPDTLRVQQVAPGMTYEYAWHSTGPWAIHTLTIDIRACGVELRTVKGGDQRIGRETTPAMSRRLAAATGRPVLAAVNADFFSFEPPGISEGPQVAAGRLLKSEGTHREALDDRALRLQPVVAVTADRRVILAHTRMRGEVRAKGAAVPVAAVNTGLREQHAVVFDRFWGESTPDSAATRELVLQNVRSSPRASEHMGVIASVDTSRAGVAIPASGAVIAVRGAARNTLARLEPGDTVHWSVTFDSLPGNIAELAGGYPMLLRNGRHVHHDESGLRASFSDNRHPRLAIATENGGRRVRIVLVDGRNPGVSEGMTLEELANYLLQHGITEAMNFDGGGSSTLVIGDRIVNRVSDAAGARPVANALVVLGAADGRCT
jgi:hypothetical protein